MVDFKYFAPTEGNLKKLDYDDVVAIYRMANRPA